MRIKGAFSGKQKSEGVLWKTVSLTEYTKQLHKWLENRMQEMMTETPKLRCDNHIIGRKKVDSPRSFPKNEYKFLLSASNHVAQREAVIHSLQKF